MRHQIHLELAGFTKLFMPKLRRALPCRRSIRRRDYGRLRQVRGLVDVQADVAAQPRQPRARDIRPLAVLNTRRCPWYPPQPISDFIERRVLADLASAIRDHVWFGQGWNTLCGGSAMHPYRKDALCRGQQALTLGHARSRNKLVLPKEVFRIRGIRRVKGDNMSAARAW